MTRRRSDAVTVAGDGDIPFAGGVRWRKDSSLLLRSLVARQHAKHSEEDRE